MGKDSLVWMVDYANNYQFDKEGNCFNIKTEKQLTRTLIKYTEGYCIKGKFKSYQQLRKHLVKITEVDCPFLKLKIMIKLNEKLEMRVGLFGILMLTFTVLTFIAVLFTNGRIHKVEVQTRILEREVEITTRQEPFTEEAFIQYLEDINIRFPQVVFAQAYLESSGFTSGIFKVNNNLFGMKVAAQRPTTALLLDRNHAVYSSWKNSVLDYALYQSHYLRKIKNQEEYINTIGRVYAEDPNYLNKVKVIIQQKFGENN